MEALPICAIAALVPNAIKETSVNHPQKRALVVYNPKSGTAEKTKSQIEHISQRLKNSGYEPILISTSCARGEFSFSAEQLEGADIIVAAGGDGTVGSVLEAVATSNADIPVCLVPLGTGNLLARSLDVYPQTVRAPIWQDLLELYARRLPTHDVIDYALNALDGGAKIKIDLAKVNNEWMAISAGVGPVARALARPCSKDKKSLGMVVYAASMARILFQGTRRFLISIDEGVPFESDALGVFVSNVPNFGVGTPEDADQLSDGRVDVFVFECEGTGSILRLVFNIMGWIIYGRGLPPYLVRRAKVVKVTAIASPAKPSIRKPRVAVDGDPGGFGPLEVTVVPHAATVFVPKWLAENIAGNKQRGESLTQSSDILKGV